MPKFIVPFTVPEPMAEEKRALLPAEQARVREMMAEGALLHIFVSSDFSEGWIVFAADSPEAVLARMDTLPMRRYMSVRVVELLG
jgi:muconolactone delta-isomerase